MKARSLIFLLALFVLPLRAGQFHCTWNFEDFTGGNLAIRQVTIQPVAKYGVNTNTPAIIPGDLRSYRTTSATSLTVSNLLNGRSYRVTFYGPLTPWGTNLLTVITNSFDADVSGLVDATDYLAASLITDSATVAYSQAAADALFLRTNNIIAGDNITVELSGNDVTINSGGTSGALTNNQSTAVTFASHLNVGGTINGTATNANTATLASYVSGTLTNPLNTAFVEIDHIDMGDLQFDIDGTISGLLGNIDTTLGIITGFPTLYGSNVHGFFGFTSRSNEWVLLPTNAPSADQVIVVTGVEDGNRAHTKWGITPSATLASYVSGTLSNNITGRAGLATNTIYADQITGRQLWVDYRLTSGLIADWWFNERSGTNVSDHMGTNHIDLNSAATPNYTWMTNWLNLTNGMIQTPGVCTNVRTVVLLCRVPLSEDAAFMLSGGNASNEGLLLGNDTSGFGYWIGQQNGVRLLEFENNSVSNDWNKAYSQGHWQVVIVEFLQNYNTRLGFGGRHSTTSSRCTSFDIAYAAAYNQQFTHAERQQVYESLRKLSRERGWIIDWRDATDVRDQISIMGQSNGDGRAYITNLTAAEIARGMPSNITMFLNTAATPTRQQLQLGVNQTKLTPATYFGPAMPIAWRAEDELRRLEITQYSPGGTKLNTNASSGWNVLQTYNANALLWEAVRHHWRHNSLALAAGVGLRHRGVAWVQGESDCFLDVDAAAYQTNLVALIGTFRHQLAESNAPFVISGLPPAISGADSGFITTVRTAQTNVAAAVSNTKFINAQDLSQYDGTHYDTNGVRTLGKRLYLAVTTNSYGVFQLERDLAEKATKTNATLYGTVLVGTVAADNAPAGSYGEYAESKVASGSAVSLTTDTAANVTSLSLSAGDWDVEGSIGLAGASATYSQGVGGLNTTSATLPTDGSEVFSAAQFTVLITTDGVTLPRKRINISETTTVYLVAKATFSAGTMSAFGVINARRVR